MAEWEVFLFTLFKVILLNLVLSGDNAIVIAMVSRNFPPEQQKVIYLWGSAGALFFTVTLTLVTANLLTIPFLQGVSALFLIWIAIQLLTGGKERERMQEFRGIGNGVKTLILADVLMSLDNSLSVTAAAKGNPVLIGIGLAVSIPLIVWGSSLLTTFMNRFPIILYTGAILLGYTSGEMILEDRLVGPFVDHVFPFSHWLFPSSIGALVMLIGWLLAQRGTTGSEA